MTKLLDVNAIAERLDMNAAHVRDRLSKRKDFPPAHRVGRSLRWEPEDIERWIESRKLSAAARKTKRKVKEQA